MGTVPIREVTAGANVVPVRMVAAGGNVVPCVVAVGPANVVPVALHSGTANVVPISLGLETETLTYLALSGVSLTITQALALDVNIKAIKAGGSAVLTGLTANLSQIAGTALVTNPSVDLRPYVGFKGTWSDSGTQGVGFFGAAGTGETYAPELITNGTMELDSNWASTAHATTNARSSTQKHAGAYSRHVIVDNSGGTKNGIVSDNFVKTAGGLYRRVAWLYPVVGLDFKLTYYSEGTLYPTMPSLTAWGNSTDYFCAGVTETHGLYVEHYDGDVNDELYVDDVSVMQVTAPSTTGTTITATKGGAQNWGTVGSTPNAASFTVTITKN